MTPLDRSAFSFDVSTNMLDSSAPTSPSNPVVSDDESGHPTEDNHSIWLISSVGLLLLLLIIIGIYS